MRVGRANFASHSKPSIPVDYKLQATFTGYLWQGTKFNLKCILVFVMNILVIYSIPDFYSPKSSRAKYHKQYSKFIIVVMTETPAE